MRRVFTIAMIALMTLSSCAAHDKAPKQKEVKTWNYRTPKETKPLKPEQQLLMMIVTYGLVSMIVFLLQL